MKHWLLCLLLLLLAAVAPAQEINSVNGRQLDALGVDRRSFAIIHLSEDGRQVLAWDRPPVMFKAKGQKVRLWLFNFDSALKFKDAKSYPLDIPSLEQAHYTQDGKSIVLITRQGADFLLLNLADGSVKPIMTHVKGEPGFRSSPSILTWTEGKLITVGWTYDGQDNAEEVGIAEVNPDLTGAAAFTPGPQFGKVERGIAGLAGSITISPRAMFFYGKQNGQATVYAWTPAGGLQPIDKGTAVEGWWGEQARFLYSLAKAPGTNELVVYDGVTGARRLVATTEKPYESLSMSRDAQTVIGCELVGQSAMNVLAATDTNGFQMRPLLKNWPLSTLRISPDGKILALYDPTKGLTIVRI